MTATFLAEAAKPRSGWERKAIDMFKPLRDAGEDMRMAARQKAYKHVLSVIVPSLLNDIAGLVTRMYPNATAYERWMLLTAAENLAEIVREKSKPQESVGKVLNVLQAAMAVSKKEAPMSESGLQPKRGWTRQIKDVLSGWRSVGVDLRRGAQSGDYVGLLAKVFPGVLSQVSQALEHMFPEQTVRQRKLLKQVADELADLSTGVVTDTGTQEASVLQTKKE